MNFGMRFAMKRCACILAQSGGKEQASVVQDHKAECVDLQIIVYPPGSKSYLSSIAIYFNAIMILRLLRCNAYTPLVFYRPRELCDMVILLEW